ncbi:MAG: preprotein translocase subunit SecA [Lacipirellulaceae bacterium]
MATLPQGFGRRVQALLGSQNKRLLARWAGYIDPVTQRGPALEKLNDYDFRKESLSLRYRARSGEPLDRLVVEGFALVREAGRRAKGMRHFDVQLLGGAAAHHGSIIEMQTGEGKTLTATLPMYLAALDGKGAHLATVNDYLAARDAELMKPLYAALGMTVGVIQSQMQQADRGKSYACDVTYGTANEMGFDFLRDRLLKRRIDEGARDLFGEMLSGNGSGGGGEKPAQRDLHFMLVDEADSILIDEARTPLIISALPGAEEAIAAEAYQWAAAEAAGFVEDEHYDYEHKEKRVDLMLPGRRRVRELAKPPAMDTLPLSEIYEYAERAIKVAREMFLDRHYVVRDDEIVIVDEFTGRLAEGRKWRSGLHQAVEAKEGVPITFETNQAARITIQDLFLRYNRLAGMTGTASTSSPELRKIYKVHVLPIPTNRPPIRAEWPALVFGSAEAKWGAIVEEIKSVHATGRPVLVGTRSIDKSERLATLLEAGGIATTVLNARHVAREAEIVSGAGQPGRVTVATNMAGRGTDIQLGTGVHELGGLHVICSELHESRRIDRQLIGRCGRQGDPGSYRQFLSLDDEILLVGFGPKRAESLKRHGAAKEGPMRVNESLFTRAQRRVERRHFRDRKVLLYHDKERQKMQRAMSQDPYLDSPG